MSILSHASKPLAVVALLGMAASANAAFQTVSSLAEFNTVAKTFAVDTFNDLEDVDNGNLVDPVTRTVSGFTYTASDYTDSSQTSTNPFFISHVNKDASNTASLSSNLPTDYVTFDQFKGQAVMAIGGNFFNTDFDQGFDSTGLTLVFTNATGTHSAAYFSVGSASAFFGIVSDSPITSLSFSSNGVNLYPTVDNLTFAAAVPEPETYALMLGGLGIVAWLGRRQKKQAA